MHLIRNGALAEFPDCVTARGAKHQLELAEQVKNGIRCALLYIVQRGEAQSFRVAADLDPAYAKAAEAATMAGVETFAYSCNMEESGITLKQSLLIK